MLKNYFLTAWRTILRHKVNSVLNIVGLSIGLTASLLLGLFAQDELGFDKFQPNLDNSYRVIRSYSDMGRGSESVAVTPAKFHDILVDKYSNEVEDTTYFSSNSPYWTLFKDNKKIIGLSLIAAKSNLDHFFEFKVLHGAGIDALKKPDQLLLSRSQANRIFGTENVLGKTLKLNNEVILTIAGVFEDMLDNSHIQFDSLYSMESLKNYSPGLFTRYNANFFYTYVHLKPDVSNKSFAKTISKHIQDVTNSDVQIEYQPLKDIHLHSKLIGEFKRNGSYQIVQLSIILSLFIMMVACFNFINLTTARAVLRAKEVGIRKAIGASRTQLIAQFLLESIVTVFIASLLSILFLTFILPTFNDFSGKDLTLIIGVKEVVYFILFVTSIGILSGFYPAFFISSFNTIKVLNGETNSGRVSVVLRKVLVTIQCIIVVLLIIASSVFYLQIQHLHSIPLGYERNNVLVMPEINIKDFNNSFTTFKTEALKIPGINFVSSGEQLPTMNFNMMPTVTLPHNGSTIDSIPLIGVNYQYMTTLGVEVLAGRDFNQDFEGDYFSYDRALNTSSVGVIINESAMYAAGWDSPSNAINQAWNWQGKMGHIVGVIKDIHFKTAHDPFEPMFFALGVLDLQQELIIISYSNSNRIKVEIDNLFSKIFNYPVVNSTYLSSRFDNLYLKSKMEMTLILYFTILIIVISCFGLFGLALFSSETRNKEIALRKVLGSSLLQLLRLMSSEFSKLIIIANLLAWPISYYIVSYWLVGYHVRISMPWFVFFGASLISFSIVWGTVSTISLKYAMRAPIKSLKHN